MGTLTFTSSYLCNHINVDGRNKILALRLFDSSRNYSTQQCNLRASKQSLRCQHSSAAPFKGFTIPEPTWSISSLQLHESHSPVCMEDLKILAKRSVLDLRRFNDATKQQLCQDLGNMLHMMKQVQSFQSTMTSAIVKEKYSDDNDPTTLYDMPRGVTEAPFRIDDNHRTTSDTTTTTIIDQNEQQMSQSVRESYLEPKMTRVGGHQYYEIITSIQRTNVKNNTKNKKEE